MIRARNAAARPVRSAAAHPGEASAMSSPRRPRPWHQPAPSGGSSALSKAYPDLKANQNMLSHQEEPELDRENKVAFARQAYNDAVMGVQHAQSRSIPRPSSWPTFSTSAKPISSRWNRNRAAKRLASHLPADQTACTSSSTGRRRRQQAGPGLAGSSDPIDS